MLVIMLRGLFAITLLAVGCASQPPREYYGPVGADFGETIGEWSHEDEQLSFHVRCQGYYLNEVDGRGVCTLHLQLTATCTSGDPLTLPLELLSIDVLGELGRPHQLLPVSEVWECGRRLDEALVVPGWSRRAVDMFFDAAEFTGGAPELLRLRFGQRDIDGTLKIYECQFFRLAEDDPRRPDGRDLADPGHGYMRGYYLPGWGDLGERRLRSKDELRMFHMFHEPDEGLL
jgi:hypothetical protein